VVVVETSDDVQETSKRLTISNSQMIQAPKAYFPEGSEAMNNGNDNEQYTMLMNNGQW
jgi:hypothetical protein